MSVGSIPTVAMAEEPAWSAKGPVGSATKPVTPDLGTGRRGSGIQSPRTGSILPSHISELVNDSWSVLPLPKSLDAHAGLVLLGKE